MAPVKKKGAPASASKPVRRQKPSTPEREAKLKAWHDKQRLVQAQIKENLVVLPVPAVVPGLNKPKKWTDKTQQIFLELVTLGIRVEDIAKRPDMPKEYVLWSQIADEAHPISRLYAQGKQERVARLEEEIEHVSRTPTPGKIVTHAYKVVDGQLLPVTEVREFDSIEHRKLLIDTLKWTLAHTRPKKHGRQPDTANDKPNDQLSSLFAALASGPRQPQQDEEEE